MEEVKTFMNIIDGPAPFIETRGQTWKHFLEGFWRPYKYKKEKDTPSIFKDSYGKYYPYPKENKKKWKMQDIFIYKLREIENKKEDIKKDAKKIAKHKYANHEIVKGFDCYICGKSSVFNHIYYTNDVFYYWRDDLLHYVIEHNIKPSDEFMDFVLYYVLTRQDYGRDLGVHDVVITQEQSTVLDSLLHHGSKRGSYERDCKPKIAEHSGFLDFNIKSLEAIHIDTNEKEMREGDTGILMPQNNPNAFDYEFLFHTHPIDGKLGNRAKRDGILYEMPSIPDIFHFIIHHNDGQTQGSIVNAPEGLYVITEIEYGTSILNIGEESKKKLTKLMFKIQDDAIEKYGTDFTKNHFYSVIAQDTSFIKRFNKLLNKSKINIDYFPRVKNKFGKWVLPVIKLRSHIWEEKSHKMYERVITR
jgi:hypothetical protein